jgi:hypothetical protein
MRILNRHCEPPPFNVGDIVQTAVYVKYKVLRIAYEVPVWDPEGISSCRSEPQWTADVSPVLSPSTEYRGYAATYFSLVRHA